MVSREVREVIGALNQVKRVAPSAEATQRAMERTRELILSRQEPQRHLFIWRTIMRASIAASILVVVGVLATGLLERSASAAEALKEIAAANRAHKGWIHVRLEPVPRGMQPKGGPRVTSITFHINPEKNLFAKVVDFGSRWTLDWESRADGIRQSYDSQTKELLVFRRAGEKESKPVAAQIRELLRSKKDLTPWQLGQTLFAEPTMEGIAALVDYGCGVKRGVEGVYDRFELTMPRGGRGAKGPFVMVLIDRQTKLIQEWRGEFEGMRPVFTFSYGEPGPGDVYGLGVPREAKVSDVR